MWCGNVDVPLWRRKLTIPSDVNKILCSHGCGQQVRVPLNGSKAVVLTCRATDTDHSHQLRTRSPSELVHRLYIHSVRWVPTTSTMLHLFTDTPFLHSLHWPLCASIILASSAASRMVNNDTVVDGLMWYWGAGIGMSLVCMVGLDLCHRDMNKWNSTKLPRVSVFVPRPRYCLPSLTPDILQPFRVTGTFLCSLIFILLPLASSHLTTLSILSISAGILIFIVCFDFYGRTFTISTRKKMMSTDCELRRRRVREEGVGVVEKEEEEGDGEGGKRGREDEMQFAELGGHM